MEQTKMTDSRLLVMLVSAGRHAGAERVRHAGLAEARDIIVGAFDGQQCSAAYGRRIHPCPAPMEQATRKRKFVEGERDHVEEQLPWNVHHSQEERKKWMGLQIRTIIRKRLPAQFPTRAKMAREICEDRSGLGVGRVNGTAFAQFGWHHRGDSVPSKPIDRPRPRQAVELRRIDPRVQLGADQSKRQRTEARVQIF